MAGYNAGFSTKDSHLHRNGNLITFFFCDFHLRRENEKIENIFG